MRGRKKGFSLLEVLVAFDILAISLFFIIGLVPFDNASVKQDAHIMVATQLGQELLQNIANMYWNDGSGEDGVPLSSQWDGFLQTGTVDGSGISTGLYCISSPGPNPPYYCPTSGATIDPIDQTRAPDSFFPPFPYGPATCNYCTNPGSYGSQLISTTSDGVPDSRDYYFYVDTDPLKFDTIQNQWLFTVPTDPNLDPGSRYVQVIVFWHEETRKGMSASGPASWQQAGYRHVTLSGTLARKGGQ